MNADSTQQRERLAEIRRQKIAAQVRTLLRCGWSEAEATGYAERCYSADVIRTIYGRRHFRHLETAL
jgi:hypothetical protein